jgi:hypothetical protein
MDEYKLLNHNVFGKTLIGAIKLSEEEITNKITLKFNSRGRTSGYQDDREVPESFGGFFHPIW